MSTIDLTTFDKNIVVRQLRMDDFDQLVSLQFKCFPGMKTWSKEQLQSQLDVFPEGQLCIEYQGKLVASCSSVVF